MALRLYGGTSSDFLTDPAGNWDGAGAYSVFTDRALTTDVTTSVTDKDGNPFTGGPVADAVGLVEFTLPDSHTDYVWVATFDPVVQAFREPIRVGPADLPARVATVETSSSETAGGLTAEITARQQGDTANVNAIANETLRAVGREDAVQAAAETYTDDQITALKGGAAGALDTLAEIDAQMAADEGSAAALAANVATKTTGRVGPTDPAPTLTPGTEYVWFQTDGAGTLLDILTGVA